MEHRLSRLEDTVRSLKEQYIELKAENLQLKIQLDDLKVLEDSIQETFDYQIQEIIKELHQTKNIAVSVPHSIEKLDILFTNLFNALKK